MEEDIIIKKDSVSKTAARVDKILEDAIEKGTKRLAYEAAHDEHLLTALAIVREFIKRKKRVCYGGTAMNALLPPSEQFYDPEVDLPDYDFYTPDLEGDVEELVRDLKKQGFEDVYSKIGIHDGTKKVLVNFTAIADVSHIDAELFGVLFRRSKLIDGLHYTDENILRMMMYLELSRPRGMLLRWKKVFERLQLINKNFPIKGCTISKGTKLEIPLSIRKVILEFIIEWKRILCNGPITPLYRAGIQNKEAVFRIQNGGPVLFTSPDPKIDAAAIKNQLGDSNIIILRHRGRGDIIPERLELRMGDMTLCIIVKEIACHAYIPFSTEDKRTINIGSLEFLITLYLSLIIFTQHSEDVLGQRIQCQVREFIKLIQLNYSAHNSKIPIFSLYCRGHQKQFSSLLREKMQRQQLEKEKIGTTRRRSLKRRTTRKSPKKNSDGQ